MMFTVIPPHIKRMIDPGAIVEEGDTTEQLTEELKQIHDMSPTTKSYGEWFGDLTMRIKPLNSVTYDSIFSKREVYTDAAFVYFLCYCLRQVIVLATSKKETAPEMSVIYFGDVEINLIENLTGIESINRWRLNAPLDIHDQVCVSGDTKQDHKWHQYKHWVDDYTVFRVCEECGLGQLRHLYKKDWGNLPIESTVKLMKFERTRQA